MKITSIFKHVVITSFLMPCCIGCGSTNKLQNDNGQPITNKKEIVYSSNFLDLDRFTRGKAMDTNGHIQDFPGGYTDVIPVKANETIIFGDGINNIRYMRYVAAFDSSCYILPDKGNNNGTCIYTVPEKVSYIRISLYSINMFSDSRINKSKTLLRYEPFYCEVASNGEQQRRNDEYNTKYRPFSTFCSKEEIEKASYKPIGALSKPYFCLISDDGSKDVATYSIPMAISKGVSMTFGLMKYSEVLQEPYLSVLKDAVYNHGFEVAQHGWTRYTEYTEDQLNYFFDLEKEYLSGLGFDTKSAICPAHCTSELVQAVASQRFDVLRSGYLDSSNNNHLYGWHANGPESNRYCVDCINIGFEPLSDHIKHIDDACENNWLFVGFFHEDELDDEKKSKIESIIDYAKSKGMEFCTLSQIINLV